MIKLLATLVISLTAWQLRAQEIVHLNARHPNTTPAAEDLTTSSLRRRTRKTKKGASIFLSDRTIVGGTHTDEQEYPFFVRGEYGCGATLIAPDVVLGAAHCKDIYGDRVLVGPYEKDEDNDGLAQYRRIMSDKIIHPKYNVATTGSISYDFVLFKIRAVTRDNLKPAELALNPQGLSPGELATAIGFGMTAFNESESPHLLKASVRAMDTRTCEKLYNRKVGFFDESVLCTQGEDATSCYGDSGGPLVDENHKLVGVLSFGTRTCDPRFPAGSMSIASALDWITEQTCQLSDSYLPFCPCVTTRRCSRLVKVQCGCVRDSADRRECFQATIESDCCANGEGPYTEDTFQQYRQRCGWEGK